MAFPVHRPRRLRRTPALRRLAAETRLSPDAFVLPLFVVEAEDVREPIASLPGHFRYSPDRVVEAAREAAALGLPAVLLFGVPARKDAAGSGAYAEDGVVQQAVRRLKDALPDLVVITDVCLCEYTDHGHCGLLAERRGRLTVDNDPTLELLARTAVSHARAGADIVAPSDMMDGRVGAIRRALDAEGFTDVAILSYAAKYASAFYGPFREAAESAPAFGDRRGYQMDPANAREALREMRLDLEEGADMLMVKPAGPYLDVLRAAREAFDVPLAAYQVSGEYAMIHAAAERGWLDREAAMWESLTGIARAGADILITYFALEAARRLQSGGRGPAGAGAPGARAAAPGVSPAGGAEGERDAP
ncbi:MAG: porphobilinogen synthase [Firmicutes bacterium]|nr:porphobilinogen synthase [Bacillota bacterium]